MHFFITGLNSFIGLNLSDYLIKSGHKVSGSVSSEASKKSICKSINCHIVPLGTVPPEGTLSSIDCIIHLAWSSKESDLELNIAGTLKIIKSAQKSGVKKQLFISSYSAHENAESAYGKGKYLIENQISKTNIHIIRPGLVIGKGGLCQRMIETVNKFPIIPILGGAQIKVPVIGITQLCEAILKIMDHTLKEYNLHVDPLISMQSLLQAFAIKLNKSRFFISIPILPVFYIVKAIEFFCIRIPIKSSSIIGLLNNQEINRVSHLNSLQISPLKWEKDIPDSISNKSRIDT